MPRRPRAAALEQLAIALPPTTPLWRCSRLVLKSAHHERILQRLEFVRSFFPELEGVTIRVGLAQKRGVLGWGSLDPEQPGIWVRPRRLDFFTVAHEMTHLLQARRLVPGGERACDLWTLARSSLLVDTAPSYLKLPAVLRHARVLSPAESALLHREARRALESRTRGDRGYIQGFERAVAAALGGQPRPARALPPKSVIGLADWPGSGATEAR